MFVQQNTGFDPSQSPTSYDSAPVDGERVGGTAYVGALGAIGGDAGKGTAIGAEVGAAAGLLRRGQKQQQARAQRRSVDDYNQKMATYKRAVATCMQGRGYAVS